jgi:hypothetical protein
MVQDGLRFFKRSLGRFQLNLKRARIDLVEDVTDLDVATLMEWTIYHNAGDPRAHLGDADRGQAARQFTHKRLRRLAQRKNRYLRRGRERLRVGWSLIASR